MNRLARTAVLVAALALTACSDDGSSDNDASVGGGGTGVDPV